MVWHACSLWHSAWIGEKAMGEQAELSIFLPLKFLSYISCIALTSNAKCLHPPPPNKSIFSPQIKGSYNQNVRSLRKLRKADIRIIFFYYLYIKMLLDIRTPKLLGHQRRGTQSLRCINWKRMVALPGQPGLQLSTHPGNPPYKVTGRLLAPLRGSPRGPRLTWFGLSGRFSPIVTNKRGEFQGAEAIRPA